MKVSDFETWPSAACTVLVVALAAAGCSSSDAPSVSSEPGLSSGAGDAPDIEPDSSAGDDILLDEGSDDSPAVQPDDETPVAEEPSAPISTDQDPAVTDPLSPNLTRVDFQVTVPAYVSDTLQLELSVGDQVIAAEWLGDEFWSATAEIPTNRQASLLITFSDDNGRFILASHERPFGPLTSASQELVISADQFETERWDDDGDGISNIDERTSAVDPAAGTRLLIFTETRGFRHDSIPHAVETLQALAGSMEVRADVADDSDGVFTDENLATYSAVVWALTSGDVLDTQEQAAFERYIRAGGGYAGIHAASDTEYDWPWYGDLVGAYFERHPAIQSATQIVEAGTHVSTAHLPLRWVRTDEWYDYRSNPRARVNVLLSLDEDTYEGGGMGADHPSAWFHEFDGGRAWYTGGGHTMASYDEPEFQTHLLGGLLYATGR